MYILKDQTFLLLTFPLEFLNLFLNLLIFCDWGMALGIRFLIRLIHEEIREREHRIPELFRTVGLVFFLMEILFFVHQLTN